VEIVLGMALYARDSFHKTCARENGKRVLLWTNSLSVPFRNVSLLEYCLPKILLLF
jgi:hypothetical protein